MLAEREVNMTERVKAMTYSVEETAEILGLSTKTVYDLCSSRDFPALRIGRRIRVNAEGLRRWIDVRTNGAG